MDDVTLGLDMDHAEATLLPAVGAAPLGTVTPADAMAPPAPAAPQAQEAVAGSPDRRKEVVNPFVGQSQPPPPATPLPPGDEFLRVSRQCRAAKCFRLQWEVESASRAFSRSVLDAAALANGLLQ